MRFIALQFIVIVFALDLVQYIVPFCVLDYLRCLAHWFLCFHVAVWIIELIQDYIFTAKVDPKNKAVLITGCDTGFGNAFARLFHKRGYKVFAACLDVTCHGALDLKEKCHNHLQLVQLDVTDDVSVKNALQFVKDNLDNTELWAIINNAGVLKGFQIELSRMEDYELNMQVNALGMVRVTKAFLPLLRKSRGRVVNICSMAGRTKVRFLGAYMMSKAAAVAFTEILIQEMREFGVRVISIEPEFFRTPMCSEEYVTKNLDQSMSETDEEVIEAYGLNYIEKAKQLFKTFFLNSGTNVELVHNAVESAVTLQTPADIYKPMRNTFTKLLFMVVVRVPMICSEAGSIILFYLMGLTTAPKTGINLLPRLIKM